MQIRALLRVTQRRQNLRAAPQRSLRQENHEGGHDLILANGYTNDRDIVKGGSGYDKIKVNDGDRWDTASGGAGGDWCIVDSISEAGTGCSRVSVR
ncbi:MAG TPA: hypothetical protein VFQ10_11710 [Rubrobacter sp.]|nr:hypothetical protein [Rubrobacter sp.]